MSFRASAALGRTSRLRAAVLALCAAGLWLVASASARALEAVPVSPNADAIELLPDTQLYPGIPDKLQVSTAPGPDGIIRRIEVRANHKTTRNWAVFALSNPSDEQLDRLLVAPHYRMVGSGVLWPDLGSTRIVSVTPSQGFSPQRVDSTDSDIYRITLDPGSVVTYVLELKSPDLPQLRLWNPDAYRDSVNAYTLYRGIVIGIAGLLALFFAVLVLLKGSLTFGAGAALAWVVFGYVLVDFSFLSEITGTVPSGEALFRASTEVLLALMSALFLYAYLNLNRWHVRYSHAILLVTVLFLALFGLGFHDPHLSAGVARIALGAVGAIGLFLIGLLAVRGSDRAIMLIPTWLLFVAWLAAAGLTVTGRIDNDIVQPALDGALVLIVLLIAFTVMQHAFASSIFAEQSVADADQRSLALLGSGDVVWDWDVQRDRIATGETVEARLGLDPGTLQGPPQDWLEVLHPQDRDRFRATLDAVLEQRRGRISEMFRLRGIDGHYFWYRLRARPVIGSDGEIVRCVGTLNDTTEAKTVEERLLHDSVRDNLTGLPNRPLFLDRIAMAMSWASEATAKRLFVAVIDLDRFSAINDQFGVSVGDSALLAVARRLGRMLKDHDSLARLGGDTFGMLVYQDPEQLGAFIEEMRRQIRTAIEFAERDLFLSASIGLSAMATEADSAEELVENAELAMRRAKRQGGDRSELFDPLMRRLNMSGRSLARDLKVAIEQNQVKLEFRPIVNLPTRRVAGFETIPSWHHPLQGPLAWPTLIEAAHREGLAQTLVSSVLERAAQAIADWGNAGAEMFASVALPSAQLVRSELANDVKAVVVRSRITPGALQLAVDETIVAANPEYAIQLMRRLRDVGASVALDRFGRGASWLALLERLPLDAIRFDTSLTAKGPAGRRPRTLDALVAVGQRLDVVLVATGVETDADATDLAKLGFQFVQGPRFGRPLNQQGAAQLVSTYREAAE